MKWIGFLPQIGGAFLRSRPDEEALNRRSQRTQRQKRNEIKPLADSGLMNPWRAKSLDLAMQTP